MNVLEQISEGMKVVDSKNHEIGKVEWVKLGGCGPWRSMSCSSESPSMYSIA